MKIPIRTVTSLTLPDLPPPVTLVDGRIGWPSVFEYELEDGGRYYAPPRERIDGGKTMAYRVVVKSGAREIYDRLARDGWLRRVEHTGISPEIIE